MTKKTKKLVAAVESYFTDLRMSRASRGAPGERSSEAPERCWWQPEAEGALGVVEMADQGAGHPDIGLYAAHQMRRGKRHKGQIPERGVVEVKAPEDDTWATAVSDQVGRYQGRYGSVLATTLREFQLVGPN